MAIDLKYQGSSPTAEAAETIHHAAPGQGKRLFHFFGRPVKPKEVLFFSSQLSLMVEIGTPMNHALIALRNQTENPAFKAVIQTMLQDIEDGRQLSDAMKRHPRVFNSVYTSMITAGETVGLLKNILDRLTEIEEKRQALAAQLRSALTYPAVLCALSTLVVIFILVSVLPKFTAFFAGKESLLPSSTRILITMSTSLQAFWWAYIISGIGIVIGLKLFAASEPGTALFDKLKISTPLIGKLSNKIYNCQLLRTLGNLMESRVPLLEALEVTRGTVGNRYFREFIDKIVKHVRAGGRFSQPFADYAYTLDSVKQMLSTGEEVGNLSRVMLRLAEFYDEEVDRELKAFSSMIEPLALVFLGSVVGLIVSSVILPIFKLARAVY